MFLVAAAIAFSSLSPGAQGILRGVGIDAKTFPAYVRSIEEETAVRERQGENEHLVFFVLQSSAFTSLPPIEPALSASEYVRQHAIPATAIRRFDTFIRVKPVGERMRYLRTLMPDTGAREFLQVEYQRTMTALFDKEFRQVRDFYQNRGHSTDTNISANYAVWNGLKVLQATNPELRIRRVLVVGPGLDFAPRTALEDKYPPQSYQPFAIADALLGLGLASQLHIDCMDINPRVLRYFQNLRKEGSSQLNLVSPPGTEAYLSFFHNLGNSIGVTRQKGVLERSISVRRDVAKSITGFRGNIITEAPNGSYDLVVATNVLIYCNDLELLLALNNISATLSNGAYFILNEIRPVIDQYAAATGLTPVQARTVLVSQGKSAPLYDSFAIYQKHPFTLDISIDKK